MTFPHFDCELRSNSSFRLKTDKKHHKYVSPIEQLSINMITQIPVADDLHLLHHGVIKRLLYGLTNTKINNKRAGFAIRWNYEECRKISKELKSIKMPFEIRRSVRGLNDLCNWKASEFRCFLHYLGIVILKEHLPKQYYTHFLYLFCATTICSSNLYTNFLDIAEKLYVEYVESFIDLYGSKYITSNFHNLVHVVDDVRNLGVLPTLSAYPFESALYTIKNLLRKGNAPLIQAAHRIKEISKASLHNTVTENPYPCFKKNNDGGNITDNSYKSTLTNSSFFFRMETKDFVLDGTQYENKWYLSNDNEIVEVKNFIKLDSTTLIYGSNLKEKKDFFVYPFKSSHLNIYTSDCEPERNNIYPIHCIKSKLVAIKQGSWTVFIPLLHTTSTNTV